MPLAYKVTWRGASPCAHAWLDYGLRHTTRPTPGFGPLGVFATLNQALQFAARYVPEGEEDISLCAYLPARAREPFHYIFWTVDNFAVSHFQTLAQSPAGTILARAVRPLRWATE